MALNRQKALQAAEKYVSKGKLDAAVKEYRKVLKATPNDTGTLNRLGDLLARQRRLDEAIDLFRQTAETYAKDGFFVKAIAIYKKIIRLDPGKIEIYEQLAALYRQQGLTNEAKTQYQSVASYYEDQGNSDGVVRAYEQMAELEPLDPAPRVKLAEIFLERKQTDLALDQHSKIAEVMLEHGHVDEAASVLTRGLELAPENLGFATSAVLSLKEAGHAAAARRVMNEAVKLHPQAARIEEVAGLSPRPSPAPAEAEAELVDSEPLAADFSAADVPVADVPLTEIPATEVPVAELPAEPLAGSPFDPEPVELEEPSLEEEDVFELEMELEDTGPDADEIEFSPAPEIELAPPPLDLALPESTEPAFNTADALLEQTPSHTAGLDTVDEDVYVLEEVSLEEVEVEQDEVSLELPTGDLPPAPRETADGSAGAQDPDVEVELPLAVDEAAEESLEDLPAVEASEWQPKEEGVLASTEAVPEVSSALESEANAESEGVFELDLEDSASAEDVLSEFEEPEVELPAVAEEEDLDPEPVASEPVTSEPVEVAPLESLEPEEAPGEQLGEVQDLEEESAAEEELKSGEDDVEASPNSASLGLLIEAENFIKYGLRDKAIEKLNAVLEVDDENTMALGRLLELQLERNDRSQIAVVARRLAALYESKGDLEAWEVIQQSLTAAGFVFRSGELSIGRESEMGVGLVDDESSGGKEVLADQLFEDDDLGDDGDFFDLAAELVQELEEEDHGDTVVEAESQSLEEIVEGFKQGVAESLSPEDFDTHFNLGIAYREMGLLDEAIGEFQLAAKDDRYLTECASLLGSCFVEKGFPDLAAQWYEKGLAVVGLPEEVRLALLYELGEVYEIAEEPSKAKEAYSEIYGINSHYRDVVAKLEEFSRA